MLEIECISFTNLPLQSQVTAYLKRCLVSKWCSVSGLNCR